jgi:AcrR family transcriptional regulator
VQRRSALRVERMLDAAAELLEEGGPDALTTSAIAVRAEVSVGSLYQFFPDKHAVAEALARRSFERFSQRLRLVDGPSWEDVVGEVIDTYVEFSRTEPGFLELSFGGPLSTQMLDPSDDNNAVVAKAMAELVDLPIPVDVLRLAVEIGDAVLALAFRKDRTGDPVLVEEAKTAVRAYLRAHLPPA